MPRERRWSTAGINPPGNWFAPPGNNQSSSGGNETAATTELADFANTTKPSGRITEISRAGHHVDILNVLPVGTLLYVQISCDKGTFMSKGRTFYVHEGIGMGVVFLDPPKDQLEILDSWLAELPPVATP